jgi:hypothetical protein
MPAAIVLDLELPWGGGNGVLTKLRESHYLSGAHTHGSDTAFSRTTAIGAKRFTRPPYTSACRQFWK